MEINRRGFLNSSLLVAGLPLLGTAAGKEQNNSSRLKTARGDFYFPNNIMPQAHQTFYISHRGVHLKQRIAGENTLESLRLAKRVGFQCVEFDVRFTKDKKAVVIHDETINRTLRDLKGNKLKAPVYVKDLSLEQLRGEYVVYTENKKASAIVPTIEEYLGACNLYQVIPFVEIKEHDLSDTQYHGLIDLMDAVIGRQNYVVTSNNKVNDRLRKMNYQNVMVMGILYQTSFEHIQSWKQTIMAISASRFTPEEMHRHVLAANRQSILTESHADTMDKYSQVLKNGIDYISTDGLMPEGTGYGQVIEQLDLDNNEVESLSTSGTLRDAQIYLKPGNHLEIAISKYKDLFLYGVTLEIEFSGKCSYRAGGKEIVLQAEGRDYFRYPVLLHKEAYKLKLNALESCQISGLRLTITRF